MDLSTTYMEMKLKHPIVPSASPLSKDLASIRQLEDAGASAVVMFSLFEEQINHESHELDHYLSYGADSFGEALSYFPEMGAYNIGPDAYLDLIHAAKQAVDIPIIGSLNGVSIGGWTDYGQKIESAGADALELNLYYIPADPVFISGAEVEQMYLDVLREVKRHISIPVALKLSPYFSSLSYTARRMAEEGVDALVLFNRFYQPDFDLENLEVVPDLVLSDFRAFRVPLRWTAILYGRIPVDFALSGGVHTYQEVLKAMMAGAKVAMMTSELLQNGIKRIGEILDELVHWMEEHEYESIVQMQGSMSQKNIAEPAAFERANYMKVLQSFQPDPTGQLI